MPLAGVDGRARVLPGMLEKPLRMKLVVPASSTSIAFLGSIAFACVPLVGLAGACSSSGHTVGSSDGGNKDDATHDGTAPVTDSSSVYDRGLPPDLDAPPPSGAFCALPGSVIFTEQGPEIIPGGADSLPSLAWLNLPVGFCAHYFAHVPTARQLRFAPDGHLFVASPTSPTTGGAGNGVAGIVVVPDDNGDGVADQNVTYLGQLPSTQGLMFNGGYLYFQDGVTIRRIPFKSGDLSPSGSAEAVTTVTVQQASEHWPKLFDFAQDGTMYVTNGSTQSEECLSTRPVFGAIFKVAPGGGETEVAKGFRNPIALRCEPDHDVCIAAELALDYSGDQGGREKLVPVRQGDDWGFPCCASRNVPYANVTYGDTGKAPDCSQVALESDSFLIGHTPFGLDFESGKWPTPWGGRVFVTLHGVFGTWEGARIVGIARDPNTGLLLPATDIDGGQSASDNMIDFATGWDDGRQDHGRPAAITFAPDGRMFVGDDQQGAVIWIAPVNLLR
jgi:glucose/arabinose dehydrogenase